MVLGIQQVRCGGHNGIEVTRGVLVAPTQAGIQPPDKCLVDELIVGDHAALRTLGTLPA